MIGTQKNIGIIVMLTYNKEFGFYRPSFFYMQIDTSCRKIEEFVGNDKATFYHEYIHFLQDISTTHGLFNFCNTIDIIKTICNKIYDDKLQKIVIPIKITFEPSEVLREYTDVVFGDTDLDTFETFGKDLKISEIKSQQVKSIDDLDESDPSDPSTFLSQKIDGLEEVIITFESKFNNKTIKKRLGSNAISESMAYLIEKHLCGTGNQYIYPYKTISLVADYFYPQNRLNDEVICALCDVSLMSEHPGIFLYYFLSEMQKDSFYPASLIDIYSYANNKTSLIQLLTESVKTIVNQIFGIFKGEHLGKISILLSQIILKVLLLRIKTITFISDIFKYPPCSIGSENYLKYLMNLIGIPLLFNKNSFLGFYLPDKEHQDYFLHLRALFEIYNVFYADQINSSCALLPICSTNRNYKNIIDENCKNSPWVKSQEKYLCPFAQYIKIWGLQDKEYKKINKIAQR